MGSGLGLGLGFAVACLGEGVVRVGLEGHRDAGEERGDEREEEGGDQLVERAAPHEGGQADQCQLARFGLG